MARVSVNAIKSSMFKGDSVSPTLEAILQDLNIKMTWDPDTISADIVILHNPSFLKFQTQLNTRIIARQLIVVAHENFLRPGGGEAFDVANCLDIIDRSSVAIKKIIAPISSNNRTTIEDWMRQYQTSRKWSLLNSDWHNICEFTFASPSLTPDDRRGRHSRAGFEKYPSLSDMDKSFPKHSKSNVILGADTFIKEGLSRPHWQMIPFRGLDVAEYFEKIDFMVYFTSATWRESFGRVIAEAIAAGKVVITDTKTASTFSGAVVSGTPSDVDDIVKAFVSEPMRYTHFVTQAQEILGMFSANSFREKFLELLCNVSEEST
jgi:hypothetical protein